MNYKVIGILMAICIVLVAIEFIIMDVSAEENGSYVIVTMENLNQTLPNQTLPNQTPRAIPYNNNTRITQGQCVEIGGVYDVSGVIGFTTLLDYNAFAYYTRYEDAYDPSNNASVSYIHKMPNNRIGYYQFFVDPAIFKTRLGYWYQYTGQYERAANKRAFYVSDKCIKDVNETTVALENNTPTLINPLVIESRHVSDILLANDDPLFLDMSGECRVWVFGTTKSILAKDIIIEGNLILDKKTIRDFNAGVYTIGLQTVGADGKYAVDYTTSDRSAFPQKFLTPIYRSQPIVDITGLQPTMIKDALINALQNSDDGFVTYNMTIEEPHVDISGYQETKVGNFSVLEVTGYTNKIPGTPITLYIDRKNQTGKSIKYPSMTITTEAGNIGDYRTFHGYLPLIYDEIAPGYHQLEAMLPSGKMSQVSFYIREEPAENYIPPTYHRFVDGNPFIPTPTPIIIEKEVIKEVTKVVINETTVYIPVDYNRLATDTLLKAAPYVGGGILVGIPLLYVCLLAIRVFAERRIKYKVEVIDDPKRTI